MDDVTAYKLRVVGQRRDLEKLIALFEGFKEYVDRLAEWIKGDLNDDSFRAAQERFALRIEPNAQRFTVWNDGEEMLHYEIFTLVRDPQECRNLAVFKDYVVRGTLKFQQLLEDAREELATAREELAIIAGEDVAATVAPKPQETSTIEKVKVAEAVLDKSFTWGERIVTIGSWVVRLLAMF
jgi:hypothetical protein